MYLSHAPAETKVLSCTARTEMIRAVGPYVPEVGGTIGEEILWLAHGKSRPPAGVQSEKGAKSHLRPG